MYYLLSCFGSQHGSERKNDKRGSEVGAGLQQCRAASAVPRCGASSGISSGSVALGVSCGINSLIHGPAGQPGREVKEELRSREVRGCQQEEVYEKTVVGQNQCVTWVCDKVMRFSFCEHLLKVFCRSQWCAEVGVMGLSVSEFQRLTKVSEKEEL